MKLRKGLVLRPLGTQYIVTGDDLSPVDFSKVVSMNATSAYLWDKLGGSDFAAQDMADLLTARYDVDAQQARADVDKLLASWREAGLIAPEK